MSPGDRIRVVAEFSGTRCDSAGSTNPDYFALSVQGGGNNAVLFTCRGPDSGNSNKFTYLNYYSGDKGTANTATTTGATTSFSGAVRLELDGRQENWYTAADRGAFSPPGLTDFPIPGDITPQGRIRMATNTGQPKLVTDYWAPFTSSAATYVRVGFDVNQGGTFSGSLRRLTIFRYGTT